MLIIVSALQRLRCLLLCSSAVHRNYDINNSFMNNLYFHHSLGSSIPRVIFLIITYCHIITVRLSLKFLGSTSQLTSMTFSFYLPMTFMRKLEQVLLFLFYRKKIKAQIDLLDNIWLGNQCSMTVIRSKKKPRMHISE